MIENSEANRLKLANAVVEQADFNDTVEMAIAGCYELYKVDEEKFQEDWNSTFGE